MALLCVTSLYKVLVVFLGAQPSFWKWEGLLAPLLTNNLCACATRPLAMEPFSVRRLTTTRIPTVDGEFTLSLYENSHDDKDHLALIHGDIEGEDEVLVRVHSECFTGDVLGSLRCDCGEQLNLSMRRVAEEGRGIILYLRQEGRGIGLLSKLRAYDLQDEGYDTVEANRMLGHGADERDYTIAALMLQNLGISSVRLLTNNPEKIESLEDHDIHVAERVPLEAHVNRHNVDYLRTKVDRMRHLLELGPVNGFAAANAHGSSLEALKRRSEQYYRDTGRPFVTLTYAQSLDGSIASHSGHPLSISGEESTAMTHQLRALHDAILVGIGTVLSDNPRLNVRRSDGNHPRPIVLDSSLRFPLDARLLTCEGPPPIVVASPDADSDRQQKLEAKGATVLRVSCSSEGGVCLDSLLQALARKEVSSVMVEGGTEVLTSFLRHRKVQHVIVTIAPMFIGGTPALKSLREGPDPDSTEDMHPFPELRNIQFRWEGGDLVLEGDPKWSA